MNEGPSFLLIDKSQPTGKGGTADGSEEWGYIPVRPGASMFYWFYKTTHHDGDLKRPIILWLQVKLDYLTDSH